MSTAISGISRRVTRAVDDAIAAGEIGMQVAVYLHGELVIDLWAGIADGETQRQVDGETLFPVFSATKGVAATALHLQADRGLIEYDRGIADYWPEFATKGKERATVRQALAHSVGLPSMPAGTSAEQMCDWDWMCRAIAAMTPEWEPGSNHGYHAYTFGWIVGELVRRTDPKSRPFGQFLQDELCRPLGIEGLWMGIPGEVEPRVARLRNMPPPAADVAALMPPFLQQAIPPHLATTQEVFGRPDVRRACLPGAGGIMNARSLARHYALLAEGGELDGVRLVSPARIESMLALQSDDTDIVIGRPYRRGMGYWLGGPPHLTNPAIGPNPRAFGHPGAGGSIGWADPDSNLAVAIVKNRMLGRTAPGEDPVLWIADAVRKAVGR